MEPLLTKGGTPLTESYYLLNPSVNLDAAWIEKSDVKVFERPSGAPFVQANLELMDKVVMRRSVVEGHYVWGEERHMGGRTLFPDTAIQIA